MPDHAAAKREVQRQAQPDLRAAPLFVAVVQIEQDLAHIAAMAGMASGDVGGRDRGRHLGAQISHQLLDETLVG